MREVEAPDLEVEEDLAFQRRQWRVQRMGWCAMALIVAAAMIGLLGPGPLSSAAVGKEPLRLVHGRFHQRSAPVELRLHVKSDQRLVQLWIEDEYAQSLKIDRIVPQPQSERAAPGRLVLVLDLDAQAAAAAVTIHGKYAQAGLLRGRIGLVGGPELSFKTLVYP